MRRLFGKFTKQVKKNPEDEPENSPSSTTKRQAPPIDQKTGSLSLARTSDSLHPTSAPASSHFNPEEGGVHRPGNGYDPEGEARLTQWVSQWQGDGPHDSESAIRAAARMLTESAKPNPTNTALREWRRERPGLVPVDDPEWVMDDANKRELEQSYAEADANAYRVPEDDPVMTRMDMINMVLDKTNLTNGKGNNTSIPKHRLPTVAWPFGTRNTHPNDRVCTPCTQEPLHRLMVCNNPHGNAAIFRLDQVKSTATTPGCPMCRVLLSTFRGSLLPMSNIENPIFGEDTVIRVWWDAWASLTRAVLKDGQIGAQGIGRSRRFYTEMTSGTLCELSEKARKNESMMLPRSQWQYGFQLMESPYPDNGRICPWFGNGRLVGGQVATDRVRAWLGRCLMDHKGKCGLPQPDPYHAGFRAIDVETRCVVEGLDPSNPSGAYVALSYVWGKSAQLLNTAETRDRLGQPGGLSDSQTDIPQTIKDAMILTERMRLKYLWVDALCIRQDDDDDRSAQLIQMDQVYSRALITIVSACGEDCNSGLAGVQPGSRSFAPEIETIEGIQLSPFAQPFRAGVLSSEWDMRGWTLQEKLLSHRVIVVTPTQMFWKCANGTWYEDCWLETPEPHSIAAEYRWDFFDDESADHFDRYRHLATAFVFRKFTHESDAENAIKGINRKLSVGLGSAFHCGVPEKYLDAVILWDWPGVYNRMLLPRMEYFPSWSWISLTIHDVDRLVTNDPPPVLWGAATNVTDYMDSHTRMRRGQWPKICSLVEYYRFDSAGDAIKIESSVFQGNVDKEFAKYLIEHELPPINIPMIPLRFYSNAVEYVQLATVLRTTPQAHCLFPHGMRLLLPRMLGFCAQTAHLYVSSAVERPITDSKPIKCDVALDEGMQHIIGSVMLNYWHRLTQPSKMLFAVVARHVSNGPHVTLPRASGWFFHCLLLEQAFDDESREVLGPYSDLVYRKVAVMFDVDCEHWEKAKPTLNMVMLI